MLADTIKLTPLLLKHRPFLVTYAKRVRGEKRDIFGLEKVWGNFRTFGVYGISEFTEFSNFRIFKFLKNLKIIYAFKLIHACTFSIKDKII